MRVSYLLILQFQVSLSERGKILNKAGGIIRENLEEIAHLEVKDTGKPIWEARVDVASCADALEYFGGIAPSIKGKFKNTFKLY